MRLTVEHQSSARADHGRGYHDYIITITGEPSPDVDGTLTGMSRQRFMELLNAIEPVLRNTHTGDTSWYRLGDVREYRHAVGDRLTGMSVFVVEINCGYDSGD